MELLDYPVSNALLAKACRAKQPINGTFELTSNCNFNCKMCYVHSCRSAAPCIPAEKWIQLIDSAAEDGLLYVLVTGGEPLLHPDFCKIFHHLAKLGMLTVMNTNGYLIDAAYVEFLKKNRPIRMNITLYGMDDEVYNRICGVRDGFSVVDRNIRRLKENGFNVNLNMTFVRDNVSQLRDMIAYAKDLKIEVRPTSYVFPSCAGACDTRLPAQQAAEAAVELYFLLHSPEKIKARADSIRRGLWMAENSPPPENLPGVWCRAGKCSYWVHADGAMSFCGMTDAGNMPNAFKEGFQTAWNKITEQAEKLQRVKTCASCRYRYTCRACYAMLHTESADDGNIGQSYPCVYYKAYTDFFLKEYEKILPHQ